MAVLVSACVAYTGGSGAERVERVKPAQQDLSRSMAKAVPDGPGRYSVGVLDRASGMHAQVHGDRRFVAASTVKVDILSCLLLQRQSTHAESGQDSSSDGVALDARQRHLASEMIRDSDNDAADALWRDVGEVPSMRTCYRQLGMRHTTPNPQGHWGLTTTSASDRLHLLSSLTGDMSSPLTRSSKEYVLKLMRQVTPKQRWGVPKAASAEQRDEAAVKNGWLPRGKSEAWVVNSTGRIRRDGRDLLVVVLSDGQPSYHDGITRVEEVARAAVPVMRNAADSS